MGISINNTMIAGYLGKDPELRHTQNQTSVASFSVATTETFEKNGQKTESTEWHNVVVWGAGAESAAKYLKKGSPVCVEGKLTTRKWQDKDGKDRWTTEVNARRVHFLEARQQNQQQATQQPAQSNPYSQGPSYPNVPDNDQVPF